jgi:peptide/nickel transport system substrate-binding protein
LLDTYRGVRLAEGNKLEVYVDFWHFEQGQIAAYASPAGLVMPWEVLAAMDDIVFTQRRGAYSDTAAARFGVSWLSLVMPTDAGAVNRTLRAMDTQASVPSGVFVFGNASLVSPQEAQARYKAASDWFQKYNHLVVSQGPFFLAKYDPPAQFAEIQANRDPSYPYKPGDTYLGRSPSLAISDVQTGTVTVGKAADVTASVKGPGKLGVRYVLIDPAKGRVVQSGEAAPGTSAGNFKVTLTQEALSGVQPGLYHLYLAAYSDQLATLQERKVDLDVRR